MFLYNYIHVIKAKKNFVIYKTRMIILEKLSRVRNIKYVHARKINKRGGGKKYSPENTKQARLPLFK